MGITFTSGAYINFADGTNTILNVSKATVGVWFRRNGRPASYMSFMSKHSGVASFQGFGTYLDPSAGADQDKMHLYTKNAGGGIPVGLMTAPQNSFDGNWHLFSANLQTANGAQNDLYLDGGNKVSVNASAAWDMGGSFGLRFGMDIDTFWSAWDGSLAHGFFYNEILTDAEHMALGCGVSPLSIRPHALLVYLPMTGPNFVFNSIKNGLVEPTISGTLSQAAYDAPLAPLDGGFLFDRDWFEVSYPVGRKTRFNPVRSARRR